MTVSFQVEGVRVEPHAAAPTLLFAVEVASGGDPVDGALLRCQLRIEPHRRRYTPVEERRLLELFGETPRCGDTLKPFLWAHTTAVVPAFTERATIDLPVSCSYDLEVAAAKYMHALDDGEIPAILLFSGTLFRRGAAGMRVEQVPWDREARVRVPVKVWRDLMDAYFPRSGWLRLSRETLDLLLWIKARRALATFDDVVAALARGAGEEVPRG